MGTAVTGTARKHQSKASVSRISTSSGSESNYYDFPIIPTKSRSRSPDQPTTRSNKQPEIPDYSEVDPGNPLGNAVDLFVNTMSFVKPEIGMGSVLEPYTTCQDKDLQKFLEDCFLIDHAGESSKKSDDKSTGTSSGKRSKHGWRNNKFLLKPVISKHKKVDSSSKKKTNHDDDDIWKGVIDEKEGDVDEIITISMSDDDTLFIDLEEDNTWTTTPEEHHQKTLAIDISKVVTSEEKIQGATTETAPSTPESHHLDEKNVKEAEEPEYGTLAPWQIIEAFFAINNKVSEEKQTEHSQSNTAPKEVAEETKKEELEPIENEISSTSNDDQAKPSQVTKSDRISRRKQLRSSILALSSRSQSNSSVSKSRRLSLKKVKLLKVIRKPRSSGDSIASNKHVVSTDENSIEDQFSEKQDESGESLQNSVSEEEATDSDSKHSEGHTIETPSQSSTSATGLPVWTWWLFNINQNEENDENSKDDSGSQSLVDSQPFESREDTTFSGTDDNTFTETILSDNDTNHDSWIMSIDQLASYSEDESRETDKSDDSSSSSSSSASSEMERKKKSKRGFRRLSKTLRKSFSSIKRKNSLLSKRGIESTNSETEPTLPSKNIVTVVTTQVTNTASTVGQMKNKLHKGLDKNSMCEESTASASSNSQSWTRDDKDTQQGDYFYGFGFFQCHEVIRE